MELVELAGRASSLLATLDSNQGAALKETSDAYVKTCDDLRQLLMEQLSSLAVADGTTPYRNAVSTYTARKELEIAAQQSQMIITQLSGMLHLNKE